jgi:hypothetical protein
MIPPGGTRRLSESYAERRFREGLSSWRRKARPLLILFFGLPGLCALVWGVAARQPVGLACGILVGTCTAAWALFRDSPPAYLEHWRRGAEGERRTRRELLKLGWHFIEDVPDTRGNYDHVVVGPAGVFHLETKYPSGIAEVVDGALRVRGRHGETRAGTLNVRGRVLGGSAALCREIERQCRERPWVNGVVVLWSPFPQRVVESERIVYLHGKELRGWLGARRETLEQSRITLLEGALDAIKQQREEQSARATAVERERALTEPGCAS